MRSSDIINLYEIVGRGAEVTIIDAPLAAVIPGMSPRAQLAEISGPKGNSPDGRTTAVSSR